MKKNKILSAIQFYDLIADEYNEHLSKPKDIYVRQEVASFFKSVVPKGDILDFGGGTGLDLPWLLNHGYKVFFCEPSANMKSLAEVSVRQSPDGNQPIFLENCDFKSWTAEHSPIPGKVNGILSNFGALNYIDDLPGLFEKFSILLETHGSVVINILYVDLMTVFTKYFKAAVKAVISGDKMKTWSGHKNFVHEATLLFKIDVKKAAEKFFVFRAYRELGKKSEFMLIHLVKK